MPQQLSKIFRFLVGLIFLLSGLLKAIDTAAFADLMSEYGATWFGFAAPLIIFIEIFLGIMLVFDFYPKQTAIITSIFLLAVSSIYLYGITARGIINCGCFGPITWLNSIPWLTFLRNAILLLMLLPSFLSSTKESPKPTISSIAFMALIAVVVMFMCGFSMHGAKCLQNQNSFQPIPLKDSQLSELITCSPDSTYLVFAFSYSCPYCQNSIGNVNQYQQMGLADKVIALALEDSIAKARFDRLFDTNFEIREISQFSMYRLTTTLPTTFFIRHDTIFSQYSGMVVSPALLIP